MAKIIQTLCDFCLDDEREESARGVLVTLDASKPKVLDVCEQHEKEIIEPLRDALARFGQSIEAQPMQQTRKRDNDAEELLKDRLPCLVCNQLVVVKSMASHVNQVHAPASHAKLNFEHGRSDVLIECSCGDFFNSTIGHSAHSARLGKKDGKTHDIVSKQERDKTA